MNEYSVKRCDVSQINHQRLNLYLRRQKVANHPRPKAKPLTKGFSAFTLSFLLITSKSSYPRFIELFFNYELILIIMIKIITKVLSACYHPHKVVRLNLIKNKQKLVSEPAKQRPQRLTETLTKKAREDEVTLKTLKQSMQKQGSKITKEEHAINHLIKIETKASSLYKLHKSKYWAFSSRNLVNLLVKVLQLRNINAKQSEQTQKFMHLIGNTNKKINKLSPEDMIHFLFSLKRVKILQSDLKEISPIIQSILKEFASRTDETSMKKANQFQSLYVITLDSNIKFLHSLCYLHSISGNQYEPAIVDLIKSSLLYFNRLLTSKQKSIHNIRSINWTFYISFVRFAAIYQMPLETIISFVRHHNMHKKSYQGNYNYLFAIEEIIHSSSIIRNNCRGINIGCHLQVYNVHLFIYELIEKPNELIKMKPLHLLSHIKCLLDFTEEQIVALNFKQQKIVTLERVLLFTNKLYQKYFTSTYTSDIQKDNIEKWIIDGEKGVKEYLGPFILIYKDLSIKKIISNTMQYNKLLNLCFKNFESLTFHSQTVLLKIALQSQSGNCKPLLDCYLRRGSKDSQVKVNRLKKVIDCDAYLQLFHQWNKVASVANNALDEQKENYFLKILFTKIKEFSSIQSLAEYISERIIIEKQFTAVLIRKYVRFSQSNRSIGKSFHEKTQRPQFKKQIEAINTIVQNQRCDRNKLSEFAQVKFAIRAHIIRALKNFKLIYLILQNINNKIGSPQINITNCTLFKQLSFHFNQEIKCLHFKPLFTVQIYHEVGEISSYMKSKNALKQSDEIFKISKYQQRQQSNLNTIGNQEKAMI